MSSEFERRSAEARVKYKDIMNMPRHVSKKHAQMSIMDRAAQFSPFAALTGYDDAIAEEGRLTDTFLDMDENVRVVLDRKLQFLEGCTEEHPLVRITVFVPDERKEGGAYQTLEGEVKRLEWTERAIYFTDGRRIDLLMAVAVEGEIFKQMDGTK